MAASDFKFASIFVVSLVLCKPVKVLHCLVNAVFLCMSVVILIEAVLETLRRKHRARLIHTFHLFSNMPRRNLAVRETRLILKYIIFHQFHVFTCANLLNVLHSTWVTKVMAYYYIFAPESSILCIMICDHVLTFTLWPWGKFLPQTHYFVRQIWTT